MKTASKLIALTSLGLYDIGREAGESALTRGCFCGYNMPHEKR